MNYTTTDITNQLHISYERLRSLSISGYVTPVYEGQQKFYSQNDFDKLKASIEYTNSNYSSKQVIVLLSLPSKYSGHDLIKKFALTPTDYFKFGAFYYFSKSTIDNLINNLKETETETKEFLKGYIPVSEAVKSFKNRPSFIYDGIAHGYILDYVISKQGVKYISLDDFNKAKDQEDIISKSYTGPQIAKILEAPNYSDISPSSLKMFPCTIIRKIPYYNSLEVDKEISKYSSPNEAYRIFFKKKSTSCMGKTVVTIPEGFLTISQMTEKYGYTRDIYTNLIRINGLPSSVHLGTVYYIDPLEFEAILDTYNNSLSINEAEEKLSSLIGYKYSVARDKKLIFNILPTTFKIKLLGGEQYRIPIKDFNNFISSPEFKDFKDNHIIKHTKDPFKVYELLTKKDACTIYKYTTEKFNIYAVEKLTVSRATSKSQVAYKLASTFQKLITLISKEFNLLADAEIEELSLHLSTEDKLHLYNFLNNYRIQNPSNCVYKNQYNRYINVDTTIKSINTQIYSEATWTKYRMYLTNIDLHIEEAFFSQSYSRIWLFSLLHFSLAWRKNDLLNIPGFPQLNIIIYNIEWFQSNTFTMTDAQYIINSAQDTLNTMLANKTLARNHAVIPPTLCIPTAIAIITTEYHCRKNKNDFIKKSGFSKADYTNLFSDNLNGFQSKKANRTLITYVFNEAVISEKYSSVAYTISSSLRSHKPNNLGVAPTTVQYIYSTNKDGDAVNVSLHLQKRGVFGWLYKVLIDIAYDTKQLSINNLTTCIQSFSSSYSVESIEGISKFLEFHTQSQTQVIKELMATDKKHLQKLLDQLSKGQLPSKCNYTFCIKGNACPYKSHSMCYCCKYSIPTNYSLLYISSELNRLLDNLEIVPDDNATERIYYTAQIISLLNILAEAKKEFANFDSSTSSYVNTFTNLTIIKNKFDKLKNTKFLLT